MFAINRGNISFPSTEWDQNRKWRDFYLGFLASGSLTGALSIHIFCALCMKSKPHVAVVGATGAVGIEMIKMLEKRNFPLGELTLLASARSAGKKLQFRGQERMVREL